MNETILRSILIVPANKKAFVEKAHLRGADAVALDLEDSIPADQKTPARKAVKDALGSVSRSGSKVYVRINNHFSLIPLDLAASVHRGLNGIIIPKVETAEEIFEISGQITQLEFDRGLETGHIRLSVLIETPLGLMNIKEIVVASDRIESMCIGTEDLCFEMGVEPSRSGDEIFFALSKMIMICKAVGKIPLGILGSIAAFRDLDDFGQAVARAKQLGCEGSYCIHPDQVKVLNRNFSPSPDKVDYARRVIEIFENGVEAGTAAVKIDGKMIDTPIYNRAKRMLQRFDAISEFDRRK